LRFATNDVTIAGLLRRPSAGGPHPAVVLLAGSRPTTKEDERLHAVASAFVASGFAVLTTDARGTGDSSGDFASTSVAALAQDATAAVAELRKRSDVRREAIGIWGVSQGATWVGPLAAEQAHAAFLVAVSGPLV
jgi:dipeptidyl aminopeptidase/acylaminoacyl peptidase